MASLDAHIASVEDGCRDCKCGEPHVCSDLDRKARRLLAVIDRATREYDRLYDESK
jgi:hypothetical protein